MTITTESNLMWKFIQMSNKVLKELFDKEPKDYWKDEAS